MATDYKGKIIYSLLNDAIAAEKNEGAPKQQTNDNEEEDNSPKNIVIDNGSYAIKAGFAGDSLPCTAFKTVIGKPAKPRSKTKAIKEKSIIGIDAELSTKLKIYSPIQKGEITNWDDIELIWDYLFKNKLNINPKDNSFVFTDVVLNRKNNREKTTQIMFETFSAKNFFLGLVYI